MKNIASRSFFGIAGLCLYICWNSYLYNIGIGFSDLNADGNGDFWFIGSANLGNSFIAGIILLMLRLRRSFPVSKRLWATVAFPAAGVILASILRNLGLHGLVPHVVVGFCCGCSLALLYITWLDVFFRQQDNRPALLQATTGFAAGNLLGGSISLLPALGQAVVSFACLIGSVLIAHVLSKGTPDHLEGDSPAYQDAGHLNSMLLCFFIIVGVDGLIHASVLNSVYESIIASVPLWAVYGCPLFVFCLIALFVLKRWNLDVIFKAAFGLLVLSVSLMPFVPRSCDLLTGSTIVASSQACSTVLFLVLVAQARQFSLPVVKLGAWCRLGSSLFQIAGSAIGLLLQMLSASFGLSILVLLAIVSLYPLSMAFQILPKRQRKTWMQKVFANELESPAPDISSQSEAPDHTANEPDAEKALDLVAARYQLTAREREILSFLARGRAAKYIAAELVISENTAWTHIKRIYAKTHTHGRQELMDLVENESSRE